MNFIWPEYWIEFEVGLQSSLPSKWLSYASYVDISHETLVPLIKIEKDLKVSESPKSPYNLRYVYYHEEVYVDIMFETTQEYEVNFFAWMNQKKHIYFEQNIIFFLRETEY